MGCGATNERDRTLKIYTHARATAHSHARRHMRNPLNSSHAPSAAAGVSHRICKTLALLPPACAVMGSSAGSSAAQKSHASERRQSSTARIGTLKSTSQANAQSIEQHTPGIEELNLLAIAEPQGVDQELSCRELGSATRKQARPTQRNSEVEEQEFCKMCETYKRCCASSAESYIHAHRCLILVHGV
jgi:hypothetical protein